MDPDFLDEVAAYINAKADRAQREAEKRRKAGERRTQKRM